jgi:uncharacterized membrane protein YccF (DUF307 family)
MKINPVFTEKTCFLLFCVWLTLLQITLIYLYYITLIRIPINIIKVLRFVVVLLNALTIVSYPETLFQACNSTHLIKSAPAGEVVLTLGVALSL